MVPSSHRPEIKLFIALKGGPFESGSQPAHSGPERSPHQPWGRLCTLLDDCQPQDYLEF